MLSCAMLPASLAQRARAWRRVCWASARWAVSSGGPPALVGFCLRAPGKLLPRLLARFLGRASFAGSVAFPAGSRFCRGAAAGCLVCVRGAVAGWRLGAGGLLPCAVLLVGSARRARVRRSVLLVVRWVGCARRWASCAGRFLFPRFSKNACRGCGQGLLGWASLLAAGLFRPGRVAALALITL